MGWRKTRERYVSITFEVLNRRASGKALGWAWAFFITKGVLCSSKVKLFLQSIFKVFYKCNKCYFYGNFIWYQSQSVANLSPKRSNSVLNGRVVKCVSTEFHHLNISYASTILVGMISCGNSKPLPISFLVKRKKTVRSKLPLSCVTAYFTSCKAKKVGESLPSDYVGLIRGIQVKLQWSSPIKSLSYTK